MSETTLPTVPGGDQAVVMSRRSPLSVLWAMIRNPLEALPPEVFHHPVVCSRLFCGFRVYLTDPPLIHETLVRHADSLSKGPEVRRALGPALGNGLLTADGADWRWQRQSVAPAFQHARLLGFLPAMIAAATRTRERWDRLGSGAEIDVGHEMMLTTFDIIVETMLSGPGSLDVARVERSIAAYLQTAGWVAALAILKAPDGTPYPGRRRAEAAAAFLRASVTAMIAERRRAAGTRDDLVGLLLAASDPETGRTMTDGEIADNLLTFITAGHETTAQGLGWTLHLLARHPEIEAKVLEEVLRVTGGEALRPDHVGELGYTRQVFAEAMRLYPPAPMIMRRAERGFQLGGLAVPAGAAVLIPIYALHRHSSVWQQPERFDPDRFAPEAVKARHRYSYLPFGAGPRVCIGSAFATMEAVAVLAVLISAFRLHDVSRRTPVPTMRITLRPRRQIRMRVEPRGPEALRRHNEGTRTL